MMKAEQIKVGRYTYTRRRWVGRKPAPADERRVQYPARIPARLMRLPLGRTMTHIWFWKKRLPERKGQPCRVVARGAMNSICVEFADGHRVITSRYAVRLARPNPACNRPAASGVSDDPEGLMAAGG